MPTTVTLTSRADIQRARIELGKLEVSEKHPQIMVVKPANKRTVEQNAAMWPMLTDISKQVDWYGNKLTPDEWKDVLTAALKRSKTVPGVDGGFVVLGLGTSGMDHATFSELLLLIRAFGDTQSVRWSAPKSMEELYAFQNRAKGDEGSPGGHRSRRGRADPAPVDPPDGVRDGSIVVSGGRSDRPVDYLRRSARHAPHCMYPLCRAPNVEGELCLAHSNELIDGRGFAHKSDDTAGAIVCPTCHAMIDGTQGDLSREERHTMHRRARVDTVCWWQENGYLP